MEKCFDSLWNQECLNDLWDAGCQDDKMHILAMGNEYAMVAIKTSEGNTKKVSISNIIMQGTVNSGFFVLVRWTNLPSWSMKISPFSTSIRDKLKCLL